MSFYLNRFDEEVVLFQLAAIKLSIRVLPLFPQGDHSTSLTHKTINVLSVCAAERGMVADDITYDYLSLSLVQSPPSERQMQHG